MKLEGNGYMIENEGRTQASRYMDVSLDIYSLLFLLFSRNFYYFLLEVGRIMKRRIKWIGEWRKMTYEKVGMKGVEWVGGRHG